MCAHCNISLQNLYSQNEILSIMEVSLNNIEKELFL